jgi:hypothetical protein
MLLVHINSCSYQIAGGLAVSLALLGVSLQFSQWANSERDAPVGGTGILHAIWLYRNHPELEELLEQVEHPIDDDLREANGNINHSRVLATKVKPMHRRKEGPCICRSLVAVKSQKTNINQ